MGHIFGVLEMFFEMECNYIGLEEKAVARALENLGSSFPNFSQLGGYLIVLVKWLSSADLRVPSSEIKRQG